MKFGVLALDYDGTIAQDGVLEPDVKAAIMEARARRIVAVLVTGRILSDLRQAAGDLGFVDAVVAENGAVVAFPNGQSRLLGYPHLESSSTNYAAVGLKLKRASALWKRMLLRLRGFWQRSGSSNCRSCCCSTAAASWSFRRR
jgi:predicted mannosyl-3-phosphoglycerate phosphatase (HAD superfamily)